MAAPAEGESGGFSDAYGRLLSELASQAQEEPRSGYGEASRSVREEIVRCIWFGSHFPPEGLSLDDGRRVEVLSPGWWNVEGGPDFARAELLVEGSGRVVGDVEVHTLSSGWYAHGHHRQPEYSDVALHVVMWNDRAQPHVEAENGARIPQLTLSRAVGQELEELVEIMGPDDEPGEPAWRTVEGRWCSQAARRGEMDFEWLGRLLDAAGDHRVLSRAEATAELFENHSREQLLYERIAEGLGYKNNRMPFMQLAGLLPVDALRSMVPPEADRAERLRLTDALFFHAAGLLEPEDDEADPETADYCRRLRESLAALGDRPSGPRLSRDHWHLAGVRPANYPARRLAALSVLCAEHAQTGLFRHFLGLLQGARPRSRGGRDTALRRALMATFTGLRHPYWSFRYRLGGRRLARPRALVGAERAGALVVDVLLPLLLAHARSQEDEALATKLGALWRSMPRRQDNAVTRRMAHVLFDSPERARQVVRSTRRQQGMHQLYRDCCRRETDCGRCVVYLAWRAGGLEAAG